jgi:ABC-2 type transport system permease protein
MHPTLVIAQREFLQRVQQKSFWIMLFLGPFLLLLALVVPIGMAMENESTAQVLYIDQTGLLDNYLYSTENVQFVKTTGSIGEARLKSEEYDGLLYIDKNASGWETKFYKTENANLKKTSILETIVKQRIDEYELLFRADTELPKVSFQSSSFDVEEFDKQDLNMVAFVVGLFAAILMVIFINQYANMVLRGVVEEKQNRISEIILTSIKPFHFMMGKIVGIASVAFLQIGVWFSFSGILSLTVYKWFRLERFNNKHIFETIQQMPDSSQSFEINTMLNDFSQMNGLLIVACFLFYFLVGYLLYSAIFATLGVAIGNDTDAQNFTISITLPLSLPVLLLSYINDHHDSAFVTFLSIFPFTSPTTMLLRLPFGVPWFELAMSMVVLFASFVMAAYAGTKVYRTAILMYGKKPDFKEIMRWCFK